MKLGVLSLLFLFATVGSAALPPYYPLRSGEEKQDILYDQVVRTQYTQLRQYSDLGCRYALRAMAGWFQLRPSFVHVSDEMPPGRVKIVHPLGSVAPATFEPAPNPFTGVFSGPPAPTLIRLSLAAPPSIAGFVPGMAVKFLIDGEPSTNLHVMHSVGGQPGRCFFEKTLSNIIPGPVGLVQKLLDRRFRSAVEDPSRLALTEAAGITAHGSKPENPNVPGQIFFMPTPEAAAFTPFDSVSDFREDLARIPLGTVIYEVFGTDAASNETIYIGKLRTTGRFIASAYGDDTLFFQHVSASLKR